MHHRFDIDGKSSEVWLSPAPTGYYLRIANGWSGPVSLAEQLPGHGSLMIKGAAEPVDYAVDGDVTYIHLRGRSYAVRYVDALAALAVSADEVGHAIARSPMPGVVVSVKVAPGDKVPAGAVLIVIESMKLETSIRATQDGIVERIHVKEGESFDRDAALVTLAQGGT